MIGHFDTYVINLKNADAEQKLREAFESIDYERGDYISFERTINELFYVLVIYRGNKQ